MCFGIARVSNNRFVLKHDCCCEYSGKVFLRKQKKIVDKVKIWVNAISFGLKFLENTNCGIASKVEIVVKSFGFE